MASLGCADTPVSFPSNFNLNSIIPDTTTKLRLIPFAPGPLTSQVDAIKSGIQVDENPNTELLISNPGNSKNAQYRYSQYDTRLYIPSSHKLPGVNAVGEYCIFFRNQADSNKVACLSLLLVKGADTDSTAPYFDAIGSTSDTLKRPLLTTLFAPTDEFIEYVGADLRNRTKSDPTPSSRCDTPTFVTYFVCTTPVRIGGKLDSLYTGLGLNPPTSPTTLPTPRTGASDPAIGPPQPSSAGTYNLIKYISLVKGIQIGYPNASTGSAGPNGPQTSALKCYRIDPAKDITGGKVVIKSAAAGTLAQELNGQEEATGDSTKNTVGEAPEAGDIEEGIAIAAGVVLVVLGIVGFVFWYRSPSAAQRETQRAAAEELKKEARRQAALDADKDPNANEENEETEENTTKADTASLPKDSIFYATIGIILGFILALFLWMCFFASSGSPAFTTTMVVLTSLFAIFGGSYFFYNYFTPPK